MLGKAARLPIDIRAAGRAEVKADLVAAIRSPSIHTVWPFDAHARILEIGAAVKHRACPPLAGLAMTEIDPRRFSDRGNRERAAMAPGRSLHLQTYFRQSTRPALYVATLPRCRYPSDGSPQRC